MLSILCSIYCNTLDICILNCGICIVSNKTTSIVRQCGSPHNGCSRYTDVLNPCTACRAEETRATEPCNRKILHLKEIPVEFSAKSRICVSTNRGQCIPSEVNIILEHIVARKVVVDILQFCPVSDQLIVVIRRCCRSTIDFVGSCCRCRAAVTDMCCTTICRIRIHNHGIRGMHIGRIEEADAFSCYFHFIRRDVAHIDDISFSDSTRTKRRCASHKRCLVHRRCILCGNIEISDVD